MAHTLLTDDIWQKIQDTMRLHGCYCSKNSRNIMEAILWKLRTGAIWRDIPQELCPWQTTYNLFNHWEWRPRQSSRKQLIDIIGKTTYLIADKRYDKLARNYKSMIRIACILICCKAK